MRERISCRHLPHLVRDVASSGGEHRSDMLRNGVRELLSCRHLAHLVCDVGTCGRKLRSEISKNVTLSVGSKNCVFVYPELVELATFIVRPRHINHFMPGTRI